MGSCYIFDRNTLATLVLGIMIQTAMAVVVGTGFASQRARFAGHCMAVPEANLIEVWRGPHEDMADVRLVGIDRRSLDEAYPYYAHLVARSMMLDRSVTVEVVDREADGTIIGRVIVDHRDVSFEILANGLARYDDGAPASLRLELAEEQARAAGMGMWAREAQQRRDEADEDPQRSNLSAVAWKIDKQRALAPPDEPPPPGGEPELEITLRSWIGAHAEHLVTNWGPPDAVEDDGAGGLVLSYDRCEGSAGAPTDSSCIQKFFANSNGYVYDRTWEER